VLVILGVAAVTVFGRLFVHGAFVAFLALHLGVLAQQGKVTLIVIKLRNVFPVFFRMARRAVFA
jgi:hypothetical protein